ncbi:MAG: TlpA disulfide reductase family protein [Candidatus Krumholzibacteriota bacterium]
MGRSSLPLVLALAVVSTACSAYELGDTAEDFTLPALVEGDGSLYDHLGDIIVLNFFTTWCPGCNEEAGHLENDIWQVYGADNVTVLAVDIMELQPLVQGWAASQGVTYPILLAPDWTLFELFPQAGGLPYNAVLDRTMTIRYGSIGFDLTAITGMIDTIIDEGQVPVSEASWSGIKALYY